MPWQITYYFQKHSHLSYLICHIVPEKINFAKDNKYSLRRCVFKMAVFQNRHRNIYLTCSNRLHI